MSSISHMLAHFPHDRVAFGAPGRRDLGGSGLLEAILALHRGPLVRLEARRVAIVGPDTAETALALLTVAATGTAAPLNPHLTATEFEFEYRDLGVEVVLVHAQDRGPALATAEALGIPAIRYAPSTRQPAGLFEIIGEPPLSMPAAVRERGGTAFVLHTSGTTGRSKIVPLLEDRLAISAANIATRLRLGVSDRTLSIMPLFHVHGLLNVLLSSLTAGSSVYFAGAFDPQKALAWLKRSGATWLSAVPAIHKLILAQARIEGRSKFAGLRFVRSSSAPLPLRVRAELECFYDCPVIESYGMTEIDQISSQELPPAARKPGSVGRSGGPTIRILSGDGALTPTGEMGEIAVNGPNCFPGYEGDEEGTRLAFSNGFFRTGDLGWLDEEGDLWLVDRVKDIIIRGGENIAPAEVERALSDHPGVIEVAAFAIPHDTLGEEVAVAIVPRMPMPRPSDLIAHASKALAYFKLPARIAFVDEMPRSSTGKLLRRALPDFVNIYADETEVHALSPIEQAVAKIWSEVLGVEVLEKTARFSDLGGTSLTATKVILALERHFAFPIPLAAVSKAECVADIAFALENLPIAVSEEE